MYDIRQLFTVSTDSQAATGRPQHFTGLPYRVTLTSHPFFNKETQGDSPLLSFEATDAELIAHGLLTANEIPSRAKGHSKTQFNGATLLFAKRMTDGRLSLAISLDLVRQRDALFADFLALSLAEFA